MIYVKFIDEGILMIADERWGNLMRELPSDVSALMISADAFWAREKKKSLIERVRNYIGLLIVERQFRRELRRPLGEGVESTLNRPQLNKTFRPARYLVVRHNSVIGAAKHLRKKAAKSKRRYLSVIGSKAKYR